MSSAWHWGWMRHVPAFSVQIGGVEVLLLEPEDTSSSEFPQRSNSRSRLPTPGPRPPSPAKFPRLHGPRPPPISQTRSSQVSAQPPGTWPFPVRRLLSDQLPKVFGRIPETSPEHPTAVNSWRPRSRTMEATPTAPFLWGPESGRGSLPACPNKLQRDWLPPYSAACAYWFVLAHRFIEPMKRACYVSN